MPPCLLRVVPIVLCIAAAPATAQQPLETRARVDSADVRIDYEPLQARDDRDIDRRLSARNGWNLGGGDGAVLTLSHPVRFGTAVVPPGRHLLRLHRDRHGTWLHLQAADDRDSTIRIPLEEERTDSLAANLTIRFEPVHGTAETIIFSYDTTSRHTDRDVYRMETEANRGLIRLVIAWGRWRWGLPLAAVDRGAP